MCFCGCRIAWACFRYTRPPSPETPSAPRPCSRRTCLMITYYMFISSNIQISIIQIFEKHNSRPLSRSADSLLAFYWMFKYSAIQTLNYQVVPTFGRSNLNLLLGVLGRYNVDVDPREPSAQLSPLHLASSHGHADLANLLLIHGTSSTGNVFKHSKFTAIIRYTVFKDSNHDI